MQYLIQPINQKGDKLANHITLSELANKCPYCHHIITPNTYAAYMITDYSATAVFRCSFTRCLKVFLGFYESHNKQSYTLTGLSTGNLVYEKFSEDIDTTSPAFVEIYNQAYSAEQQNLNQISGMGYRKALEFLIKDYLIELNPEDAEKTKATALGNCIKHQVSNPQIKLVASRAVVLGNDETHYIRKYEDKDINDLKTLINLTVRWIEIEKMTKKYEQEMP